MTAHEGNVRVSSDGTEIATCTCGWTEAHPTVSGAALAIGRHITTSLPRIQENEP